MGPVVLDELLPVLPCPDGHHHSGDMVHGKTPFPPLFCPKTYLNVVKMRARSPSDRLSTLLLVIFICFRFLYLRSILKKTKTKKTENLILSIQSFHESIVLL